MDDNSLSRAMVACIEKTNDASSLKDALIYIFSQSDKEAFAKKHDPLYREVNEEEETVEAIINQAGIVLDGGLKSKLKSETLAKQMSVFDDPKKLIDWIEKTINLRIDQDWASKKTIDEIRELTLKAYGWSGK